MGRKGDGEKGVKRRFREAEG
jgi:hypothetical protein